MPMSGYLQQLRKKIGHDLLVLPSAAVAIHDDQMRLLAGRRRGNQKWFRRWRVEPVISGVADRRNWTAREPRMDHQLEPAKSRRFRPHPGYPHLGRKLA